MDKQEINTINFYHGGVEPDFNLSQLDVLRSSQKQQNSNSSYAGFYMYGEQNHDDAIKYAEQENNLKHTTTKGVVKITMPGNIKVYNVPPFTITRITTSQIQQLQQQGYDLISGSMLGKIEYILLNKEKIINMQFEPLEKKKENTYVTLEQLEPLLSETGYMCFGHGTGRMGNSNEVVDSIFKNGLRTKDNSLYFTSIGLSTPTPELKAMYKELDLPEPSIENLKNQFNNWQHQDSKKIIIARLPMEYINQMGDRSDRNGEMFGAFYNQKIQENGSATNYLDPKFIIGCFDVEKQAVRLNANFEKTLSPKSVDELKEKYKKTLEKTKERLNKTSLFINQNNDLSLEQKTDNQDYDFNGNFDSEDIEWEDTNNSHKSK